MLDKLLIGLLRVSNKILLLEDDTLLGESIVDLLEDNNFTVSHSKNGQDALDLTFKKKFNLYLFDINVPLIDGITLLKELREADDITPTIFLTSHKDKEKLKDSFLSGADDYITKPFDNDELIFRIKAILRRTQTQEIKCINLLCLDEEHKQFIYDGKDLELSKKEYELLVLLMKHINKTVTKESIIDTLYSSSDVASDGAIRVYINRLKQILPQMKIENIRGIGYKLVS